eukprot:g995.t1
MLSSIPLPTRSLPTRRRVPPSLRKVDRKQRRCRVRCLAEDERLPGLHVPSKSGLVFPEMISGRQGGAETSAAGFDEHRPLTPPPDLPSLMLDSRIVYLGMPLVSAVTELIIAELFYLQYKDATKPVYLYINSSGTTRADGEVVGFETEGMAVFDTMEYIKNDIFTAGVGIAIGQACMLLSAGKKGRRFMLPHATAMLNQPMVPPTGQRQAIEIQIKWREVLAQKQDYLSVLSYTTGHSIHKLDKDMDRPLYMQPKDAIEYGIIDRIITSEKEQQLIDEVKSPDQWDRDAGLRVQKVPQQQ